ncbi:transposase DDE domain protein [Leptospira kirschneri str. H2]|nr:transposase DDE domain protein [Leptospira kirschneri str. H2]
MHLIINDQGELLSFMVTPGNVDDRNLKVIFPLVKNRVVEKFQWRFANCFLYPFQYNENKWRINFLTTLLLNSTR